MLPTGMTGSPNVRSDPTCSNHMRDQQAVSIRRTRPRRRVRTRPGTGANLDSESSPASTTSTNSTSTRPTGSPRIDRKVSHRNRNGPRSTSISDPRLASQSAATPFISIAVSRPPRLMEDLQNLTDSRPNIQHPARQVRPLRRRTTVMLPWIYPRVWADPDLPWADRRGVVEGIVIARRRTASSSQSRRSVVAAHMDGDRRPQHVP